LYESLPERQKRLLRLVSDGLSDAEIAERVGEPEQTVAREVQGVMTELGFRTRTHAVVYVLAREISARSKAPGPASPGTEDEEEADRSDSPTEGTAEESA
jgi:DNA-binding CsgD family transcriptional regulator